MQGDTPPGTGMNDASVCSRNEDRMKVLHVTGTYLPVRGGVPYFVHNLASQLTERGIESPVATCAVGDDPPSVNHSLYRVPATMVGDVPVSPSFPVALGRTIRQEQPDVVHANYPLPIFPEIAAIIARAAGIPFVLTGHGAFEMDFQSLVGTFGAVYNRTLLRIPLAVADRIHVSNSGIRDEIPVYSTRKSKVEVIPMGVNVDWYDPGDCNDPAPFETDDDRPVILFAGAFRRYKGLPTLIEAIGLLSLDVRLVLIGDGPANDEVRQVISQRNLEDRVELLGHVSDASLRSAYKHADIFVLPSPSLEESLGLVALEAMAMGLPTVVTGASGVGRVLKEADAGVIVEPDSASAIAEAVFGLLTNPNEYTRQCEAGMRLIRNRFAWNEIVESYVTLYEQVVNE